jgi:hypothetical protein
MRPSVIEAQAQRCSHFTTSPLQPWSTRFDFIRKILTWPYSFRTQLSQQEVEGKKSGALKRMSQKEAA